MKDEHVAGVKRQRLLMMLDEFAQFGRFETIESAMAAHMNLRFPIVNWWFPKRYARER